MKQKFKLYKKFELEKHSKTQQKEACTAVEEYKIPLTRTDLVGMANAMRHYDRRYLKQTMGRIRANYNLAILEEYTMVILPPTDHLKFLIAIKEHGTMREQFETARDITNWFGYKFKASSQLRKTNDWIPSDDRNEEEEMIYDGPGGNITGFYEINEIYKDEVELEEYLAELSHG